MKNMKLTNLSLSVLIALGLVACGGSDDKGNAATDTDTSGSTGGTGGTGPTGPKIENNGKTVPVDPKRAAPSLEVEANVATSTKVAKQLYIDRQSRDAIAGYNGDRTKLNVKSGLTLPQLWTDWNNDRPGDIAYAPGSNQGGISYNPGATDAKDILRASSIYKYYEFQSAQGSLNADGGIHANPSFSYALGENGKYYRVQPNGVGWDEIKSDTTFKVVDAAFEGPNKYGNKHGQGKTIPMSEIVFIPNALVAEKSGSAAGEGFEPIDLGKLAVTVNNYGVNELNPKKIQYFDLNRGEVEYKSFDLAGAHYDLVKDFNTNNIELDLSKVPVKKAIQNHAITLNYDIKNNQATGTLNDDDIVSKTAKVGEMKLYNLPYSRSSILVNQQAVADANDPGAAPNNIFNLANTNTDGHFGAFQVVGFQTTAIPRDGRADYVGKSYGVNSVGDIELRADFAINRAGIHGSVSNRQTLDGKRKLADLTLGRIALVDPNHEETASRSMQSTSQANDGVVTVGGRGVGAWAVALYGPNAEEAAGVIDLDPTNWFGILSIDGVSDATDGKQFEVFSSQRGSIIKDSLNPGVGNP